MPELIEKLTTLGCETHEYKSGEYISLEGKDVGSLFLLLEGKVKVLAKGKKSKQTLLWLVSPTTFFGLTSFHSKDKKYKYTTQIHSKNAKVMHLSLDVFNELIKDPEFLSAITTELCNRINFLEKRLAYNSSNDCKKRLLDLLIFLTNPMAQTSPLFNKSKGLKLSFSDLALTINATSSKIKKIIGELESKKIVEYKNGEIRVSDYDSLLKLA